jgi:hypothetical protein
MSDTAQANTGLATYEKLQDLHGLLALSMAERLKANPTSDDLSTTRAFLKDNGLAGRASTDADRKRLEKLYVTYTRQLAAALEVDRPSAAVLGEARVFLSRAGVEKDLAGAIDHAKAVQVLSMASLPFKKTPTQ